MTDVQSTTASRVTTLQAAYTAGHGVLPSLPKTDTIPNTVKKLKPFLG
jgi:hypothetical protein